MDIEIRITRKHSGKFGLILIIEDMAGLSVFFCICKFVSYPSSRAGALTDKHIAFSEPCCVLLIYKSVLIATLLKNT